MKRRERERLAVEKLDIPKAQKRAILRNMREGLLCACNATRVPYFGPNDREHGTRRIGPVLHGYDDCE